MTKTEAGKLVAMLMAAYPAQSVRTTEATAKIYEHFLLDVDANDASKAVRSLITQCKWMPTVAEIRQRVFEDRMDAKPAELAWEDVRREVSRVGIYGTPSFEDAPTRLAVAALGWRAICDAKSGDWTLRAQFIRAHQAAFDKLRRSHDADRLLEEAEKPRKSGRAGGPLRLASVFRGEE